MRHRFKYIAHAHGGPGTGYTVDKVYIVDIAKQAGIATMRLGAVVDDEGDERIFFAEDFEYVGPDLLDL